MKVYFDGKTAPGIVLFQCIRDGGGSLRLRQMIVVSLRGRPVVLPLPHATKESQSEFELCRCALSTAATRCYYVVV